MAIQCMNDKEINLIIMTLLGVILGTYEIDIQIFTEYEQHQSDINDLPFGPLHDILVYNNIIY